MYYPSLEGDWNLNSNEPPSSLQPFSIFCACNHSQITGDLIYQVYEDGSFNFFLQKTLYYYLQSLDVIVATSTSRTVTGFFAAKEKPPTIHVTVHDQKTDAVYTCGVENKLTVNRKTPN